MAMFNSKRSPDPSPPPRPCRSSMTSLAVLRPEIQGALNQEAEKGGKPTIDSQWFTYETWWFNCLTSKHDDLIEFNGTEWDRTGIPSGKLIACYGKSPCLMGKSTN